MKTLGEKIRINAKLERNVESSQSQKQRQWKRKSFKQIYNKRKIWTPSEEVNMAKFFSLPKLAFKKKLFSLPELAVYPVLCANADYKRERMNQISLENIASQAGLRIPTVMKAIKSLCEKTFIVESEIGRSTENVLKREKRTIGRRTFWTYNPYFIREYDIELFKGNQFFFYTCIIEMGIWRELDRRAKALYLALRSISEFDFMLYCDYEGLKYEEYSENVYRDRSWEICRTSIKKVCSMIGRSDSNMGPIVKQLNDKGLIRITDEGIMVYLIPTNIIEEFDEYDL